MITKQRNKKDAKYIEEGGHDSNFGTKGGFGNFEN